MSVPSDRLMELMRQQKGGNDSPSNQPEAEDTAASMNTDEAPPMGAPMSTPEPKMGNREGGLVNISMAMDLIEQALPSLGSESEEGQKALSALKVLTGILGQKKSKVRDLQQSEIIQMLQNLPKAGGATPEGRAMAQAPSVPNLPPMPGNAPGGASIPQAGGGAPTPQNLPM